MDESSQWPHELRFTVTVDNVVAGGMAYFARTSRSFARRRRESYWAAILAAAFGVAGLAFTQPGLRIAAGVGIVLALVWLFYARVVVWARERARLVGFVENGTLGETGGARMWLTEEGICNQTTWPDHEFYPWAEIYAIEQLWRYVAIWVSPTRAMLLPKSLPASELKGFLAEIERRRLATSRASSAEPGGDLVADD